MKQQQCKTSSFIIDLPNSTFKRMREDFSIYQYNLPAFIKDKYNQYAILHNWAKDNLPYPYYLNIPSKKMYVLVPNGETVPQLLFDEKTAPSFLFEDYIAKDKVHIIVKLLLAKYFELTENFVSNDKFFLHANLNRNHKWATVLKVDVSHNYKNVDEIEFWAKDEATRLVSVTYDDFKQYYPKEIVYGQSIRDSQLFFKQLKRKEIQDFEGLLFVKPKSGFVGNQKTQINYHSIMSEAGHESSRAFLLERFTTRFVRFLNDFDVAASFKELNLTQIESNNKKTALEISSYVISIVDGRKVKTQSLAEIFQDSGEIKFVQTTADELKNGDSCLFVMDYNKEDFETRFKGEPDPYKAFKENLKYKQISKQGICVNENHFDEDATELSAEEYLRYNGLGKEDFQRNLSICIAQLFLKNILLSKDALRLPHAELLNKYCFCYHNYMLYSKEQELRIEKFDSSKELLAAVAERFSSLDVDSICQQIYTFHNPFGKDDFELNNLKLIFSADSVVEIIDMPERAFYDEAEIKQRIFERNKKRVKSEFKSKGTDSISEQFNRIIDEDVEGIMWSYEDLKRNYGKGENGFLKLLFNSKDERPLLKFLNENTDLQIKGLKQDKVFSTYTGIWLDKERHQYFVGRTLGYQQKQDKGVQMKKLKIYQGKVDEELFFSLLNVDFIRYKEFTVNPYPFKLIDMYDTLLAETQVASPA